MLKIIKPMIRKIPGREFLVTAITMASLLSVGCHKDQAEAEWWQGEQERIALVHQVELKQYRTSQSDFRGFEELKQLTGSTQDRAAQLDALGRQRKMLDEELALLGRKWSELQETTIRNQRTRATGRTFQSLESASGRKFHQVSVAAIDDAGVTIRHADGSARLRFADLSPEHQVFFGLEADLSFTAEQREFRTSTAYERGMEIQLAAIQERQKQDAETARLVELAAGQKRSQPATRYVAASMPSPLAREATPIGRQSWYDFGYYPRYRYRSNYSAFRYVYYYKIPSYYGSQWQLDSSRITRSFGSR